jgi:hypothetical protein
MKESKGKKNGRVLFSTILICVVTNAVPIRKMEEYCSAAY